MTQAGSTGMFSAQHVAGTPVAAVTLRDTPTGVKERAGDPTRCLSLLLRTFSDAW